VYLSPDAPDMLTHLSASEVYVIGGLVDRVHVPNASRTRAISLGVRSARLPLL
jgi:tRNA (guanine9-N1)-methyltransferase